MSAGHKDFNAESSDDVSFEGLPEQSACARFGIVSGIVLPLRPKEWSVD